ncbi:MAG TPA: zinc-binding dehydrogenase, partial [Methylomirabilota bacterium]|nr:zinc-binding dehydrogenase [Methylomirabilota bacterium]
GPLAIRRSEASAALNILTSALSTALAIFAVPTTLVKRLRTSASDFEPSFLAVLGGARSPSKIRPPERWEGSQPSLVWRLWDRRPHRPRPSSNKGLYVSYALAHGLGAEPVFNPSREAVVPAVREFTRGRGADVVIDAVGAPETRRTAVAATRPGGAAVWIGLHADATEVSGHDVVLGERAILGSYAVTPRDLRTAMGLFAHGKIEIKPWVRPFPLEDGARVFRELATAPPRDFVKAILLP